MFWGYLYILAFYVRGKRRQLFGDYLIYPCECLWEYWFLCCGTRNRIAREREREGVSIVVERICFEGTYIYWLFMSGGNADSCLVIPWSIYPCECLWGYWFLCCETRNQLTLFREFGFSGDMFWEYSYILAFCVGEMERTVWWILENCSERMETVV